VRLLVEDIKSSPTRICFTEAVEGLNRILEKGGGADFRVTRPPQAEVTHWRSGVTLFFRGTIEGEVTGQCARCLEMYLFPFTRQFSAALTPPAVTEREKELSPEELEFSFYTGDEIDVSALVQEQILLTLPSRPLCREDCKGLCAQCGTNLNLQPCECRPLRSDSRLSVLVTLHVSPPTTSK
jgi:uncharacterized protein